jgi:hypothetical protein
VTSAPIERALAATSWPMNPAPTIASRVPGRSAAPSRPASAAERSTCTLS